MLLEYLTAVGLIFVAEMGDKTQILAMAFATKYKVRDVLLGILIGSFLNHGLAVLLGSLLSSVIPVETIQVVAGISFIGFALWTLRAEEDDDEEMKKTNYLPFITVALAFFIGELGDKTQLTAIVLSADASYPFLILLGTVTGMVITGGLGIYVGSKLGKSVPEFTIKIVSSAVFMTFGILKLIEFLPRDVLTPLNISFFAVVVASLAYLILRPTLRIRREGQTALKIKAQELQDFYASLREEVDDICLGTSVCGNCQKNSCVIGATKSLLDGEVEEFEFSYASLEKEFNNMKLVSSLNSILEYISKNEASDTILKTKKNLELILFKQEIEFKNMENYLEQVKEIDFLAYKLLQVSE